MYIYFYDDVRTLMTEELILSDSTDKESRYHTLIPQIAALTSGEPDLIANLANITAAISQTFGFLWVGFYLVKGSQLVLGPFQGPLACTRIDHGKGVCGTAWKERKTIIVPDVEKFPGHIACSSASRSEIVLPALHQDVVFLVLDIDSKNLACFDDVDARELAKIIQHIEALYTRAAGTGHAHEVTPADA